MRRRPFEERRAFQCAVTGASPQCVERVCRTRSAPLRSAPEIVRIRLYHAEFRVIGRNGMKPATTLEDTVRPPARTDVRQADTRLRDTRPPGALAIRATVIAPVSRTVTRAGRTVTRPAARPIDPPRRHPRVAQQGHPPAVGANRGAQAGTERGWWSRAAGRHPRAEPRREAAARIEHVCPVADPSIGSANHRRRR